MIIFDPPLEISMDKLCADLSKDGYVLASLSRDGELLIDVIASHQVEKPAGFTRHVRRWRRERWQAQPVGTGCDNTYWGDLPGGYEFCSGSSEISLLP